MEAVIRVAVLEAVKELGIKTIDFDSFNFVVEHPSEFSYGDYSTNFAMVVWKSIPTAQRAKKHIRKPQLLAEVIAKKLEGQIEYVDKIEVAGPGFINFYLARDFFVEEITRANALGGDWGKNEELQGEQVLLEYTSPNLFKPLHVGNLVGNIIGESLSRLYEFSGADVKRINYPSDIGLTVAKGVWGLQKTGGNPEDISALGEAYKSGNEGYENDETAKQEIEAVNRALYAGTDESLNELRTKGIKTSRARLAELCRQLGTEFDTEIFESEASPVGTELVKGHIGDIFEESEGAVVYKGEKHGLHTRVFLNSQGLPTYEAKDVGNFALKQEKYPDWSQSLVVTGGEQSEYFKVVIAAMREVFSVSDEKQIAHIPTGFLTLSTGKMSSRKGNVLTGESILGELQAAAKERAKESRAENVADLSEEVSVAALKYQILRHSLGSDIVFDKERALSFEGDSGPYLQYTYARITSVLEKAKTAGINSSITHVPEIPYEIEKTLYRFEEAVREATLEKAPQVLVTFLVETASAFNAFYAQEKIADRDDEFASYKTLLTEAVGQTLKNGLWLLGIQAPEKM